MKVQKIGAGAVFVGAVLVGMLGAGAAQADSSEGNGGVATGSNPSLSDNMGFGVVNHMKGDVNHGDFNQGQNGVGWIRSEQNPSFFAGTNRVTGYAKAIPGYQQADIAATGGKIAPGQIESGNKVTPGKK